MELTVEMGLTPVHPGPSHLKIFSEDFGSPCSTSDTISGFEKKDFQIVSLA
jgi:hypothetical protein